MALWPPSCPAAARALSQFCQTRRLPRPSANESNQNSAKPIGWVWSQLKAGLLFVARRRNCFGRFFEFFPDCYQALRPVRPTTLPGFSAELDAGARQELFER